MENLTLNQVLSHVDNSLQPELYRIIEGILFSFTFSSLFFSFFLIYFYILENDIDGAAIATMEPVDILELFDKNMKVKLQFNKLKAKLNQFINSSLDSFLIEINSLPVPFPTNTATTTASTTTTENATTSKPLASNQSSPSNNWPDYFSFPIDKASISLKDHLKDTDTCAEDLTFIKDVVKLLYNKIRDLNM